jgi:hypothetical protein
LRLVPPLKRRLSPINNEVKKMMAEFIGLVGLGITLIFTQYVTAQSTQKLLKSIHKLQQSTFELQKSSQRMLGEILRLQKSMTLCLRKIDLGMRANAKMHGWVRLNNIPPEEAAKLPEPKIYDASLRVCYFKPSVRILPKS